MEEMNMPPLPNSNLENNILKTGRKYILSTIFIILYLTLLLSIIVTAEVEINTTLEDNLVILLDYSGSTVSFRPYIQLNAIYSIQNIEDYSNISVVIYGGYIKNSKVHSADTQENKTILEEFVRNINGKEGDAARDNIFDGFDKAGKILYNSTGTKQIVLISDGNLDGKTNGILNNDALIELVKQLKKNNVTINLFQVSTTRLNPTLKTTSVTELYKDFSDKLNNEVVVLNPDERIRFFKPKSHTTIVSVSSEMLNSSQISSRNKMYMLSEGDEYLNEFSNKGETSSVISIIQYDRRDVFSSMLSYPSFSEVRFYSYCNQTCIVIPFDIEERRFFDEKILKDIFSSEKAIDLVKSGNVTESAYTFSLGFDLCDYYGFDILKKESINLGGEAAPLVLPESAKVTKKLKEASIISKFNPTTFVASVSCTKVLKEESNVFNKIAEGRQYIINLRNGFAYYGIVDDFQNHNRETIQEIKEAKNSSLVKAHAFVQSISKLLTPFIKIIENCLNNQCQGDFSIDKTNMEIFDEKLSLISNNYAQLSNQNYEHEAELSINRIKYKSEDSLTNINNAANELSEINSHIPNTFIEAIFNFIEEPETDYSMARLRQIKADDYLNKAKESQTAYKFNSANQNSNYSIAQSREGMVFVNMEKSKQRYPKDWFKLLGIFTAIFLFLMVIIKLSRQKKSRD